MKRLAVFLLAATAALAAVDGTVVNRTTGEPQVGAAISLFKLTQTGPEMLESTKSGAGGHFAFGRTLEPGPHLIQIQHAGVTYNSMLPPGQPTTGLELGVYDVSKKPDTAQVAQHIVFIEPSGQQLTVSESYFFKNDSKLTYEDAATGTVRFFVPSAAKDNLRIMATEPGGLPLEQSASETKPAGTYRLDFPIKPGETRVDVSYRMPMPSPAAFAGKALYKDPLTRLVVPEGVTLEGPGLKALGQEPRTKAMIYETRDVSFRYAIQGTGSLRAAAGAAGGDSSDADDSGPSLRVIPPPGFADQQVTILALALAALALGFVLLYRRGRAAAQGGGTRS
jgi:hypothetical protein